jgi:hypothetical protein
MSDEAAAGRSASGGTIGDATARKIIDDHRSLAELALVTKLLNDLPEFRRDPGQSGTGYIGDLVRRRAELSKAIPIPPGGVLRSRPLDTLIASLGPWFSPWIAVELPYFLEALNEIPTQAGTMGSFETTELDPGGLMFEGTPQDTGSVQPTAEKWWVHTWACSYVFPAAPVTGRLYYRFTTEASIDIFTGPALSGLVTSFISIGLTSDVQQGSPFDAMESGGFPFWITLPLPGPPVSIYHAPTDLSGSIAVQQGANAAIGFFYGVIAGIASGDATTAGGSMQTRLTLPSGVGADPGAYGKMEYRFEPDWWIQTVGQRSNAGTLQ